MNPLQKKGSLLTHYYFIIDFVFDFSDSLFLDFDI